MGQPVQLVETARCGLGHLGLQCRWRLFCRILQVGYSELAHGFAYDVLSSVNFYSD